MHETRGYFSQAIFNVATGAIAADEHAIWLTWLNACDAFAPPFEPLAEEVERAFEPHDVTNSRKPGPRSPRELWVMLLPVYLQPLELAADKVKDRATCIPVITTISRKPSTGDVVISWRRSYGRRW